MRGKGSVGFCILLLVLAGTFLGGCERNWGPPDSVPPTVVKASWVDDTHVDVTFDEEMAQATAQDTTNYAIAESASLSDTLSVTEAVLWSDGVTVSLTTSAQTAETTYTVTVTGAADLEGNPIAANNTAEFTNQAVATYTTYSADIKPIIDANCLSCHGSSFHPLTTYAQVKVYVDSGTLRQHAQVEHQAFNATSAQAVIDWIDEGAHE
ncbi:MAG: Ig-like domain-containing protein [Candidatus Latescibacterota bacterium]